jgi:hypothetical protein
MKTELLESKVRGKIDFLRVKKRRGGGKRNLHGRAKHHRLGILTSKGFVTKGRINRI